MAKVSIIVPIYNTEEYLRACLDSITAQTLQQIEILLINDGSTDSSLEIMEEYQKRYPDKIQIHTKKNGGQATARNLGIKLSTGEYIGFVDSDDYIEKTMYEDMYNKATAEGLDYVECDYRYLKVLQNGQKKELPTYGHVRAYRTKQEMFLNPLVSPWNKLYRGEILRSLETPFPEGYIYEDTSFFLKTIPHIGTYGFLPEKYVCHFLRGNSTMNANKSRRVADIFPVLQDALDYYEQKGYLQEYKLELEYLCVKILLCSSLQRIAAIGDKGLRKEQLAMTREMIEKNFSHYRKNPYFKGYGKNLYMKCINKRNMGLFCAILARGKS